MNGKSSVTNTGGGWVPTQIRGPLSELHRELQTPAQATNNKVTRYPCMFVYPNYRIALVYCLGKQKTAQYFAQHNADAQDNSKIGLENYLC